MYMDIPQSPPTGLTAVTDTNTTIDVTWALIADASAASGYATMTGYYVE